MKWHQPNFWRMDGYSFNDQAGYRLAGSEQGSAVWVKQSGWHAYFAGQWYEK